MDLRRTLLGQLGGPHGVLAPLVARILNRSNAGQNRTGVAALDVRPGDDVLDLGFGGGVGLGLLLDRTAAGTVVGVERATDMLSRARRHHAEALAAGRLHLHAGAVEDLPLADDSLDRVLSVNTYYFWDDAERGLSELARVLRPGGRLVLVVVEPDVLRAAGFRDDEHRVEQPDDIAIRARDAGFAAAHVQGVGDPKRSVLVIATT